MSTERAPFRIAFREEGEFVNAYYALPGTMDGALLIASVKVGALRQTPGAFEDYQALVRKIVAQLCREAGVPITDEWTTGPAPTHERTGRA